VNSFVVLAVCLGNVCRSPMIERILELRFQEQLGLDAGPVTVSSAGVLAPVGWPMDQTAAQELQRLGGDAGGHLSRQLSAPMVRGADLVLTVTREIRSRVLEEFPGALRRTFTVRELSAIAASEEFRARPARSAADLVRRAAQCKSSARIHDYDVADPIGQSQDFHRHVADVLDAECRVIARELTAAFTSDPHGVRTTRELS
jgi:protein-tyrosine phosphatase